LSQHTSTTLSESRGVFYWEGAKPLRTLGIETTLCSKKHDYVFGDNLN